MKKFKTHYDDLQVTENASPEVIRGAYRSLAQKWHPDRNPEQREEAERITCLINAAYAILSDPQRRREYDERIAAQQRREAHQAVPPQPRPGPPPVSRNEYEHNSSSERTGHVSHAWLILLFIAFLVILLIVFPYKARYLLVVLIWLAAGVYACSALFNPAISDEEGRQGSIQLQQAVLRRKAAGVGWLMGFISWPLSVAGLLLVGLPFAGASVISLILAGIVGLISWTITVVSQQKVI